MKGPSKGKDAEVISFIKASVQDVSKEKKNSGQNDKSAYLWKIRRKNRGQSILRIALARVSKSKSLSSTQ